MTDAASISDDLKKQPAALECLETIGRLQAQDPAKALWHEYGVHDPVSAFAQRERL